MSQKNPMSSIKKIAHGRRHSWPFWGGENTTTESGGITTQDGGKTTQEGGKRL